MVKKLLLLGSTGKMGIAIREVFADSYTVAGRNSRDFNALQFKQVRKLIEDVEPDIVINTVAFLGIDPCEEEPERAFVLNTLYPKFLAQLSSEWGFLLVHFSTDAVFNDAKGDFYTEDDVPQPLNIYGFTKYGGDCLIQAIAKRYYIFRIPLLFGETTKNTQFVEKMFQRVQAGEKVLRISDDIFSSPTYSKDVAGEIRRIMETNLPSGVYHIANDGKASLYELMGAIFENIGLDAKVERASYKDFPFAGIKNTNTPLKSVKIDNLRHWREAVKEYSGSFRENYKRDSHGR